MSVATSAKCTQGTGASGRESLGQRQGGR
jgi:hypothetical protein